MDDSKDKEQNKLSKRLRRYASVTYNAGGIATKLAAAHYLGLNTTPGAAELRKALGTLKGPLIKIFQLLAAIPDALPEEYSKELMKLQSNAPPMGWNFVKLRMAGELGPGWQKHFKAFSRDATAAASLGQVHKALLKDGTEVACKLQYPDMASAVEADLAQFKTILSLFKRSHKALKTDHVVEEITTHLRQELDYFLEAKHITLYREMIGAQPYVHIPEVYQDTSTQRLLTMSWMAGKPLLEVEEAPQEFRNKLAENLFKIWYEPFYKYGIIHGDPHLGNYFVRDDASVSLMDYGCIRIFRAETVESIINLYKALRDKDNVKLKNAYEALGFGTVTEDVMSVLNEWAMYFYDPLLDNKKRPVDPTHSSKRGQKIIGDVFEKLSSIGGITPPRAFVFIDRAAVGLGAAFMRLKAEANWHKLFNELIDNFDAEEMRRRQQELLTKIGIERAYTQN